MTQFFRQNPFLATLGCLLAVLLVGGGYLVFAETSRLSEEETLFSERKQVLENLERSKPFPNQANVTAAREENEKAGQLLEGIAASFRDDAPELTPQAFQDELNKSVREIQDLAAQKGVELPENFYLGFERYETQPPTAQASPLLGMQLRAVHSVAKVLVESQIKALGPFVRQPLAAEVEKGNEPEPKQPKGRPKKEESPELQFTLASFDVNFVSDQSAFRLAFNRILEISPSVFVRAVAIANSSPDGPPKKEPAAAIQPAQGSDEPAEEISVKPVLGRETLTVDLRLASVTAAPTTP